MGALILEGGTFRPQFSAGVMDALMDNGIEFPYVIGVSAGITYGVTYVSKQPKRNHKVLLKNRHDKRYLGVRNFLTDKSLFGVKYAFEIAPEEHLPFDWGTYYNSPVEIRVGVTNAETGKPEYLDGKTMDEKCDLLKATCAIPFMFPVIELDGKKYYDGGICDPIPVRKAQEDGHEKFLIVLTRPASYRKGKSKSTQLAARLLSKKYPKLVAPLLNRHIHYNETVRYCEQLERDGKAVILRPTEENQIDSMEKDLEKIKTIYRYGYEETVRRLDEIKDLLK